MVTNCMFCGDEIEIPEPGIFNPFQAISCTCTKAHHMTITESLELVGLKERDGEG